MRRSAGTSPRQYYLNNATRLFSSNSSHRDSINGSEIVRLVLRLGYVQRVVSLLPFDFFPAVEQFDFANFAVEQFGRITERFNARTIGWPAQFNRVKRVVFRREPKIGGRKGFAFAFIETLFSQLCTRGCRAFPEHLPGVR